jgi:hypothetical protein
MARPIKQGLDYFPVDVGFFHNKKIKNLRRAKGTIGVMTYFNLMCRIYENGYYYRFDDIDELSMDIAEEIACEQLRATASRVTETINYLVGRGILDEELFKRGIISGQAMQEQYVLATKAAKRKVNMDVHLLVDVDLVVQKNSVSAEESEVSSEETKDTSEVSTQNKIKESNENTPTTTHTPSLSTRAEEPPSAAQVAVYFESSWGFKKGQAFHEAFRFLEYNESLGWTCLPNWGRAADRWVENMEDT